MLLVDLKADCVAKKRAQREIVVSREIMDLRARLDQISKPRNDHEILRPDRMPVFDPEIKKVADDIERRGVPGNLFKKR
jgi:hypothetical protein